MAARVIALCGRRWCSTLPSADVAGDVSGWNPVQRSGFRPMSRDNMKAMVKRLKQERMELGEKRDWTKADWEEAKAEGLDTQRIRTNRGALFKKEGKRAAELRGQVKYTFSDIDPDIGTAREQNAEADPQGEPTEQQQLDDLVKYFATRIVWELEEQYRNRVGTEAVSFMTRPPQDSLNYDYDYGQANDARFLQAKYIRFKNPELPFWHTYHRDVIQAATHLFQQKMWRVRDIAYCDDMCLVFVDNRHQPHYYRAVSSKKKKNFVTSWGRRGAERTRGSG